MPQKLEEYLSSIDIAAGIGSIMRTLITNVIEISKLIRYAPFDNILGKQATTNASGDHQKKLDVITNQMFKTALSATNEVSQYVCEEEEIPVTLTKEGQYIVYIDPLDGSSNIEFNVPVGSVFGIAENKGTTLVKGSEYFLSGFALYGAATSIVLALKGETNIFTLDMNNSFILTHPKVHIPENGDVYSINEGHSKLYGSKTLEYLSKLKERHFRLRYIGSMVADVYRTLLKGGVFIYPADLENPDGKLRLMYEINPICNIIRSAGGFIDSNGQDPLEIHPKSVHQRVPIILGGNNCQFI